MYAGGLWLRYSGTCLKITPPGPWVQNLRVGVSVQCSGGRSGANNHSLKGWAERPPHTANNQEGTHHPRPTKPRFSRAEVDRPLWEERSRHPWLPRTKHLF